MRSPNDVREVQQPPRGGEVLGVRLVRPQPLEGHLVLGLLARAARVVDLVRLRVLRDLLLAELQGQSAGVHGPDIPGGFKGQMYQFKVSLRRTLYELSINAFRIFVFIRF